MKFPWYLFVVSLFGGFRIDAAAQVAPDIDMPAMEYIPPVARAQRVPQQYKKSFGLMNAVRDKNVEKCIKILNEHPKIYLAEVLDAFDLVFWDILRQNADDVEQEASQIIILLLERFPQLLRNRNASHLIHAVEHNNEGMVNLLLAYGIPVNSKAGLMDYDFNDETALMIAAEKGYANIVHVLIAHGANLDMRNGNGQTALMLAAQRGHADVVWTLLEAEADQDVKDRQGRAFLDYARNDAAVMQALHDYKASRKKALDDALKKQHVPVEGVRKIIGDYI